MKAQINLVPLRKYSKTFEQIKVAGHPVYESVFLDLSTRSIWFFNSTTYANVDLEVEVLESDSEDPGFFVDGHKFFTIVNTYDDILLEDRVFKSEEGNTFSIVSYGEDWDFPNLTDVSEYEESSSITVDPDFLHHLKNAVSFTSSDLNSPFSAVYLQDEKMVAIQTSKYYEFSVPDANHFVLPQSLARILLGMNPEGTIHFYTKYVGEAQITLLQTEDIRIKFSASSNYELPVDINSEEFRGSFDHPAFFVVSREDMISNLRFLENFARNIVNARAQVHFNPQEGCLTFEITEESHIEHNIPVEKFEDSEFEVSFSEMDPFWVSLTDLRLTLQKISGDKVCIQYHPEKAPLRFQEYEGDDSYFIIQSRLEED